MWRFMSLMLLTLTLFLLAPPTLAFAHGVGQSQDLPLPFWLYLFGAGAVVIISFVQIGLSVGEGHTLYRYPRFNLLAIGPLRAVLTSRPLLQGLRLLSVALFFLVILSGFLGEQVMDDNLAPIFVWIIWWVGFGFFTAFVGNIWPLVNPWKILFEWAERFARWVGVKRGIELNEPYPASWGIWPALVLYAGFIWAETVFKGSAIPANVALVAYLYSVLTWTGMVVFGKKTWLQRGDAFSVFFSILAKFAPTEVRVSDPQLCKECSATCQTVQGECVDCYDCFAKAAAGDRQLNVRPWAVGLSSTEEVSLDRLGFVIFMLASVAYDSLADTSLWATLFGTTFLSKTLGLIALPLLFLAVYLWVIKLSQVFGLGYVPFRRLAAAYVYSLVPIAIAYQAAHYYTYLLIQGQTIIRLVSDPFGWGWNLFGTADYKPNAGFIDPNFVWYSQIVLIIAGHVIAIYLAHVGALRLLKAPRLAMRSQYPVLGLMVLYTMFSLWILSQ
jgi:hypothetical protein